MSFSLLNKKNYTFISLNTEETIQQNSASVECWKCWKFNICYRLTYFCPLKNIFVELQTPSTQTVTLIWKRDLSRGKRGKSRVPRVGPNPVRACPYEKRKPEQQPDTGRQHEATQGEQYARQKAGETRLGAERRGWLADSARQRQPQLPQLSEGPLPCWHRNSRSSSLQSYGIESNSCCSKPLSLWYLWQQSYYYYYC